MQTDMSRKFIFLVGSPLAANLDWNTDELLNKPVPPFYENTESPEQQLSLDQPPVRWRVLRSPSVDKLGDNYDTSQRYDDPAFFISHQLAVATDAPTEGHSEDSILKFYDHSFAIHETSEVAGSDVYVADSTQESSLGEDSMLASFTGLDKSDTPRSPRILHIPGPLSNLQDLPTARYIQSIVPQTMTVNMIVGVLAVHPPRRIVTRQWKTELDLVELVVGDETRAGFGVNFWLKPDKPTAKNNEADRLGRSLASLRPRDIVLLRTVGLSTFQDRVYGQSLRRGMTTVELLHRQPVDVTDAVGFYQGRMQEGSSQDDPPVLKARRVRNWMLRFVTDSAGMSHPRGLPPDTQ